MYLAAPTFAFTIPSVHDETRLDCRLYLPDRLMAEASSGQPLHGAIVAHPYASLGGCYDDPVVSFIGGELLETGHVVGTFNFRGAADSDGRTSWTARPELADYVSFYGFMLAYLHMLSKSRSRSGDAPTSAESENSPEVHLVLGGYSYGSLIASHLPATSVIADMFNGSVDCTPVREILLAAKDIYGLSVDDRRQKKPPLGPEDACFIDPTKASISYLLMSPLLPPVSQFLTLFSKLWLEVKDGPSGKQREIPCPKPIDQLSTCPTLAIYGDEDAFTSASKLRKWTEQLKKMPGSRFQSVEVGGAGHFWREAGTESRAKDAVNSWLRQLIQSYGA